MPGGPPPRPPAPTPGWVVHSLLLVLSMVMVLFLFSAKKKAEMCPHPTFNHPPWDGFGGALGVPPRPPCPGLPNT